ncbi:DUF7693 family protein [Pseudomonas aeruginosa]
MDALCRRSAGTFESWSRFGTDPVELLSQWEHSQIEAKLQEL